MQSYLNGKRTLFRWNRVLKNVLLARFRMITYNVKLKIKMKWGELWWKFIAARYCINKRFKCGNRHFVTCMLLWLHLNPCLGYAEDLQSQLSFMGKADTRMQSVRFTRNFTASFLCTIFHIDALPNVYFDVIRLILNKRKLENFVRAIKIISCT